MSLSHLVCRTGCGIRLYRFLIIAFLSTWEDNIKNDKNGVWRFLEDGGGRKMWKGIVATSSVVPRRQVKGLRDERELLSPVNEENQIIDIR